MSDSIKVVSFNIEYCASITQGYWEYAFSWWKYIIPHNINAIWKISELINKDDIDIATFTEIDGGSYRTKHKNYLNIMSQLTNLKRNTFFPVHSLGKLFNQGNGILTKYDLIEAKNIKLETNGENRYLSVSKLKFGDTEVNVMTTQLALGHISRVKELRHIVRIINETPGLVIFTGDLNTHNEKELDILKETRLKRIETPQTFPSWAPKKRLDYVFYSPEFEVVNSYVLEELKISDHLPIVAEFKIKK
jgi:endonuclease/exonuclease/phosphatase family metal-dependent hydrolase